MIFFQILQRSVLRKCTNFLINFKAETQFWIYFGRFTLVVINKLASFILQLLLKYYTIF